MISFESNGKSPPTATPTVYLSPRQAADCLPAGPHNPAKVIRWILEGLVVDGRRLHLKAVRVGGRWAIRRADLESFLLAVSWDRLGDVRPVDVGAVSIETSRIADREARRRHRDAKRMLARMGVLAKVD
jgi:hypothetical protein